MTTCQKCKAKIDELDVYPGHICMKCHSDKFDALVRLTGQLPRPDFKNVFRK